MKKLILVIVFLLFCSTAQATIITIGEMEQRGDFVIGSRQHVQQVYDSVNFSTDVIVISDVSIVSDREQTGNGSTYDMFLSTSKNDYRSLVNVYEDNQGNDLQFFGTLTLDGNYQADELVTFTGSFEYDPSKGDLLVDFIRTSQIFPGALGSWGSYQDGIGRLYNEPHGGVIQDNQEYGLRTIFTVDAAVPEPSTMLLLGIGLAGFAGAEVRRRRKKKAVDKS